MNVYTFFDRFSAKANKQIADWERELGQGSAKSFEEYRHHVGRISALRGAISLAEQVRKDLFEPERQEN